MICCLQAGEPQKPVVCNSVQVQRPENQGSQWYKSQAEAERSNNQGLGVTGIGPIPSLKVQEPSLPMSREQDKMDIPTQAKKTHSALLHFFCSLCCFGALTLDYIYKVDVRKCFANVLFQEFDRVLSYI